MKIKLSELLYRYTYLLFTVLLTVWISSFVEWILTDYNKELSIVATIIYKLLNDFWAIVILGIILFPLFWLSNTFIKKWAIAIFQVLFVIILLIQISLIKYSLTTHVNLGADLLGYSYNDIYTTITSSVSLSYIAIIPFLLLTVLFYGIHWVLQKWMSN